MKIRHFLIALVCLLAAGSARAQNYTTVTATNIQSVPGVPIPSGAICFIATDPNSTPISFQAGGGGQVYQNGTTGCTAINNGSIVGTFNVPNPRHTLPQGIFYRVLVMQGARSVIDYKRVQFEGASFDFDLYAPDAEPPVPWDGGTVTGNQSVSGDLTVTGNTNLNNASCSGTCTGFGGGGSGGGGVNAQSGTSYTAIAGDSGKNIPFTNASASTLTLPATVPSATWFIATQAVGAGGLTVNRNGRTIDGASSNVALTVGQGIFIYSDGTNYYTMRGIGGTGAGCGTLTGDVTSVACATTIANNAVTTARINNGAVTEAKQTLADNTTGNVSTSAHGYQKKLPNDATLFANGAGNYTDPFANFILNDFPKSGMLAFLPFTDGSGTQVTDVSGNGNHCTITVVSAYPAWAASTAASGLLFDSRFNGYAACPSALNDALTIMVFIQFQPNYNGISQAPIIGTVAGSAEGITLWNPPVLQQQYNLFRLSSGNGNAGSVGTYTYDPFNGIGSIALTIGNPTGVDNFYINGNIVGRNQVGASTAGVQSSGHFQLGGGAVSTSWFTGEFYLAAFWNRVLTPAEIAQASRAGETILSKRGIKFRQYSVLPASGNNWVADGDSITQCNGLSVKCWTDAATITAAGGSWYVSNQAAPGYGMSNMFNVPQRDVSGNLDGRTSATTAIDSMLDPLAQNNVVSIWACLNDLFHAYLTAQQCVNYLKDYCRDRHLAGWNKCFTYTMTTNSSVADVTRDSFNDLLRAQSRDGNIDYVIDIATDLCLGKDANYGDTSCFQGDSTHPNQSAAYNRISRMTQHAFNGAMFGNKDFYSGSTYTSGAASATAITGATESGNTATIATTLNPAVGSCAKITGITPSGYNSPTDTCWVVLTTSGTNFTYYNSTSGLAAGSVFGVVSVPQEKEVDTYATLGGSSSSQNHTLLPCAGRSEPIYRRITDANAWTITPYTSSETINGGATFTTPVAAATNYPVVVLRPIPVTAATGGCTWTASIQ